MGFIRRPSTLLHVRGGETPPMVTVPKSAVEKYSVVGHSFRITSSTTMEMVEWSSMMANPSIALGEEG